MYNYNLNIMSKIVVKHNTDFRKIYKLILNGSWTRDNMLIYNKVPGGNPNYFITNNWLFILELAIK